MGKGVKAFWQESRHSSEVTRIVPVRQDKTCVPVIPVARVSKTASRGFADCLSQRSGGSGSPLGGSLLWFGNPCKRERLWAQGVHCFCVPGELRRCRKCYAVHWIAHETSGKCGLPLGGVLAERAGFEPAAHPKMCTAFPMLLLRPLGHLSASNATASDTGNRFAEAVAQPQRL